jgi:hypothetical protein
MLKLLEKMCVGSETIRRVGTDPKKIVQTYELAKL